MPHVSIPVLGAASFQCPHCRAIAHQDWYKLAAGSCTKEQAPFIPDPEFLDRMASSHDLTESQKASTKAFSIRILGTNVFLDDEGYTDSGPKVYNLWMSKCFSCDELAVWVHDRILYPSFAFDIAPNPDLPNDIKMDFMEAAMIVDSSPRGSAALLRLCVQKLCKALGKPGKNINDDIAALVSDGLDVRIQKSLDIVRVVGNNAVHPGKIDIDDKETASKLFRLVNLIADAMISQPKHIDAMYNDVLPDDAKAAIEKRDRKAPT